MSCLWLLENLHKIHPGVVHSKVNFNQKTLHLTTYVEYEVPEDLKKIIVCDGFDYRYINLDQI